MPTRQETYQLVGTLIDQELQRLGGGLADVWKGIYVALLWYQPVGNGNALPHIIDADKLWRPRFKRANLPDPNPGPWYARAQAVHTYLAQAYGIQPNEVEGHVDRLMTSPDYLGMQRNNALGTGSLGAVVHTLRRFGDANLAHDMEVDATTLFPGINLPGRTTVPAIDIVSRRQGDLVAITSGKWSIRHDRVGDISTECPAYKQGAYRISRQRIKYFVVTNEFDPARLTKLLEDDCVDAVVHIHKPLVTQICRLDQRLNDLQDLTEYILSSSSW